MSRKWSVLVLVAALSTPSVASATAPTSDTETELKARFRERQEVLHRLKDAGKIGETSQGLVDVVRDAYRKDGVTLPGGSTTVQCSIGAVPRTRTIGGRPVDGRASGAR